MGEVKYDVVPDGELLKWEKPGVKVEGVLNSYKAQKTAMGDGHVYEVNTKDGMVPFFAPTLLHQKLQRIEIGSVISIEYEKKTKTGAGFDLLHFIVGHAEPTEANLKSVGVEIMKKVGDDEDEKKEGDEGF